MRVNLLCFWLTAAVSYAQGIITTAAGTAWAFPDNGKPAVNAGLGRIAAVVVDQAGNVYAADQDNNLVIRISPSGVLTVVAGNGIAGYSGDGGPAVSASLWLPDGVAVDSAGNVYIADAYNNRVRKVSGGTITTVAGNGGADASGDGGPATAASIFRPNGLAVDSAGNLYIAALGKVRKVSGGMITTVAGNGTMTFSGNGGPATAASLDPEGMALDASGNLFIADLNNRLVLKLSGGIITIVAGNGTAGSSGDGGPATSASLLPVGIAVDASDNLYIADYANNRVRKISAGIITTVAGSGSGGVLGFSGDGGPAVNALLWWPGAVAVDPAGNIYIADTWNDRIRRVSGGTITTFAGNGSYRFSGDGGPASSAALNQPWGVAADAAGNIYIADTWNNRIRKISGGTITTVAGNGNGGFSGDGGPATGASLWWPAGVAIDAAGNLYIADQRNNRIRKVSGGIITTVAGTGTGVFSGDGGPANAATLLNPYGLAVDSAGNLYIADNGNSRIRKVSGGIITTVAGNGNAGFSGDGGPATAASLNFPMRVVLDLAGNLYIADTWNDRIRKVSGGTITTVAGNGTCCGPLGDAGSPINATLSNPYGVAADSGGNLYIADTNHGLIRKVTPNGIITTVVGGSSPCSNLGDGCPATNANLNLPADVAMDAAGNLYIADQGNDRIRVVLASKPQLAVSAGSLSFSGLSGGAAAPTQSFSVSASVPGLGFSASVSAGASWLSVSFPSGNTPRLIDVAADPFQLAAGTYRGSIVISAPDASPASLMVNVTFTVAPGSGPVLALDNRNLSFSYPRAGAAQTQKLTVSNAGGGTLNFTVDAEGGRWLTATWTSSQATPASPVVVALTADPTGLSPGSYTGSVKVSGAGSTLAVAVTMTISSLNQVILLSQRGLSFTAIAQGGVVPPQTFAVRNVGTGVVSWTVSTSTLAGGQGWLQVTPPSGSSDALQNPPAVSVTLNPLGLAVGLYYGLVRVNAPAAANSPQVVTVFLQVLTAGSDMAAMVDQGSMLFTASPWESPSSQNLLVYNVTANAKSFRSLVAADTGLQVITVPADATLDPQHPTPIVVQPFTAGLSPGIYAATLTLQFSDGRVQPLNVKVIVSATGGGGPSTVTQQAVKSADSAATPSCAPTKLLPALISLADSFQVPTGLPVKLGVYVKDDCGNALEAGSVKATFSNGDSPATLIPLGGGLWEGQWLAQSGSLQQVSLKLHAENGALTGEQQVSGNLQALQTPPAFDQDGIASVFGGSAYTPLAPGEVISVYGSQLAADSGAANGSPLPQQWMGTQVFISGGNNVLAPLPLYYVSPGQVNTVVPFGVSINAPLQLLVQRGFTLSQPVAVNLASTAPVLLGGGGAIADYPAGGGPWYTVTANAPAHAGDTLVLYAVGLGGVTPGVADGALPGSLTSTANAAQVQIGSQTTTAAFAGLSPQFAGLYQVNVVVPAGTGTGSAIPVTLSIGGQTSPAITMAIQ